jgi:hypothetical protein
MAVIVSVMAMLLLSTLAAALLLNASAETMLSAAHRTATELLYAADAGLERALVDLRANPDWSAVLDGSRRSGFVDGEPFGQRMLPGGPVLDLDELRNYVNCERTTSCSSADLTAATSERPWRANNPVWQLYAYGRLSSLGEGSNPSSAYVVVFVGDDPSENDDDPLRDGDDRLRNAGSGVVEVRAYAFGPRGARKALEMTVARQDLIDPETGLTGRTVLRIVSWRERRALP